MPNLSTPTSQSQSALTGLASCKDTYYEAALRACSGLGTGGAAELRTIMVRARGRCSGSDIHPDANVGSSAPAATHETAG